MSDELMPYQDDETMTEAEKEATEEQVAAIDSQSEGAPDDFFE